MAAQLLGGFIQALMTGGEAAAEAYLTAQFPFLANPVLQDILDYIVKDIGDALQTVIINGSTSLVINIESESEENNIVAAATALQLAQASGDQNAIAKAVSDAKKAYGSVFHWDGTYSVPAN